MSRRRHAAELAYRCPATPQAWEGHPASRRFQAAEFKEFEDQQGEPAMTGMTLTCPIMSLFIKYAREPAEPLTRRKPRLR
jgi:hypothetical protein